MGPTRLSADEEAALVRRVAAGPGKYPGDPQSADHAAAWVALSREVENVVSYMVNAYTGKGLDKEDLRQEAFLAVGRAAQRFDPKISRFATYVKWWIKQGLEEAAREQGRTIRLPAHAIQLVQTWRKAYSRLKAERGVPPTREEVDGALGLPEGKSRIVAAALAVMRRADPQEPLEVPAPAARAVPDPDETSALRGSLNALTLRQREVLTLRYGIGGGGPLKLREVGEAMGVTRERVRQIQKKATERLRLHMGGEADAVVQRVQADGRGLAEGPVGILGEGRHGPGVGHGRPDGPTGRAVPGPGGGTRCRVAARPGAAGDGVRSSCSATNARADSAATAAVA